MRIRRIQGGWAFIYNVRDDGGEPVRVLRVGGVYQSATYLGERRFELPFEYFRAFDRMFDAESSVPFSIRNILMIGGGGCTYPKHLVHSHDDVCIDVLERDPAVAKIGRRFFFVDEAEDTGRMRLIVADGAEYLRSLASTSPAQPGFPEANSATCDARRYDVIVNDAFNGADAVSDLLEGEGLEAVKACLSPGGLYMANVVCEQSMQGAERLRYVLDAMKRHFAHVYAVPATDESFSDDDNFIVIASDQAYEFEGAMEF